jgi:hypothetical protein
MDLLNNFLSLWTKNDAILCSSWHAIIYTVGIIIKKLIFQRSCVYTKISDNFGFNRSFSFYFTMVFILFILIKGTWKVIYGGILKNN